MSNRALRTVFLDRLWDMLPKGPEKVQAFMLFGLIEGYLLDGEYSECDFKNDLELMTGDSQLAFAAIDLNLLVDVADLTLASNG